MFGFIKFFINSDQSEPEEVQRLIFQAVSELPVANRDTLAFIIVHLKRITQSEATKMTEKGLATIFGPTIVGNSGTDLPMQTLILQSRDQSKVMEALLHICESYWNSVISNNQSFSQRNSPCMQCYHS